MTNTKNEKEMEDMVKKDDIQLNFEAILYQESSNLEKQKEVEKKEKEEEGETKDNNNSNQIPEVDNRTITPEIIEIIKKDIFNKYRESDNKVRKLKVKKEEDFLENKTLINVADLIGIRKIKFEEIDTKYFNSLLSEKSLMVKKMKQIKSEKSKEKDKEENKIEEEINLEEIKFINCEIDINFCGVFPVIKKFSLKNCKVPYDISSKINFNFLTQLVLENIGLIDDNFQHIFIQIRSNRYLKNNLKIISLKNNSIGLFDPCKGIDDNKIDEELGLSNLEVLDLSNNKIFFITNKMINALKNIKVIDLTNNGIVFPARYSTYISAAKKMSFLVQLTKNFALLNNHNKDEYIKYVLNVLPKMEYGLHSISLVNLYIGQFYEKMKTLNLSKFSNSLIELDISYGNINDNDLKTLFKQNLSLVNLKNLNISKNKLTDKILDILVEDDFQKQFSKLKVLNLSGNNLKFEKAIKYQNFFEKYKSLKLFIVKLTPFELSINNYTRTIINRYYEMERKKEYKTNFTNEDLEIQKIVENDNYLVKKTNITISLFDTNNFKYVSKIKKYFPAILERIDFETRFYDNK